MTHPWSCGEKSEDWQTTPKVEALKRLQGMAFYLEFLNWCSNHVTFPTNTTRTTFGTAITQVQQECGVVHELYRHECSTKRSYSLYSLRFLFLNCQTCSGHGMRRSTVVKIYSREAKKAVPTSFSQFTRFAFFLAHFVSHFILVRCGDGEEQDSDKTESRIYWANVSTALKKKSFKAQ